MSFKNYLVIVIMFFLIGYVSSASSFNNLASTDSFSGTTGFQYTNPSYTSLYSSSDINTYWPQLTEDIANNKCYGNTDFLVMIPPSGCTPSVVRSDLLAEQNVPVFCQLESAKVNPLIKVSSIKSISFKGKYPNEIAGVSYYPSRAALNSYTTLLGSPVVNNIGYVVIILKKQGNESASPKNVSGNLTATLYYDAEKAYGVGSSEFYLKTMSDSEWEDNKYLQGFWQGRGLLKLVDVLDDQATIQVLTPDGAVIRTETLNTGKTGSLFYFPGFYCRAALQLKLNDIDSPQDSVILSVDGIQMEARMGTKLGNTGCSVTKLNVLAGNTGTAKIYCNGNGGKTLDLSLLSLYKANLTIDDKNVSYDMASKISTAKESYYFAYAGMTKRKIDTVAVGSEFMVLIKSNSALENKAYSQLAINIDNTFSNQVGVDLDLNNFKSKAVSGISKISSKDVVVLFSEKKGDSIDGIIFNNLVTSEGGEVDKTATQSDKELAAIYFKEGDKSLQMLLDEYGALSNTTGSNYGESGLFEEIELIKRLQQKGMDYGAKKIELMNQFLELYPESSLAQDVRNQLTIAQRTDSTNAYKSVFSNNEYHSIGIVQFKPSETASKSFELVVNNKNALTDSGSASWHEGDTINLSEITGTKITNDYLIVKSITAKEVTYEYYTKKNDKSVESTLSDGSFKLAFNQNSSRFIEPKKLNSGVAKEAYTLYLSDVEVEKIAYVSIVSELKTRSEANFTFNIGIEQRTIQLSPEKAKTQADELNKTIKSWEDKNAQLGKVIEGWKAACLATGLVLNVKNLITGFTGQSTARQEVMRVYKDKCKAEMLKDNTKFSNIDTCYNSYSDDIAKDVEAYTGAIEGVNTEIEKTYHGNLSEFQQKSTCSYKIGEQTVRASQINSWSEARQCLLYSKLSNNAAITPGLKNRVETDTTAQLGDIAANTEANKGFETSKAQLPDLLKSSYFTAQIESGKVKVTTFSPVNKSRLKEVMDTSSSVINEFNGVDENLGIATTNYANKWYLLVRGGSSSVSGTYTFTPVGQMLKNIEVSKTPTGLPNDINVASWDVDSVTNKKCVYNYTNPTVRFYDSTGSEGMPALVPIDIKEGWYVYIPSTQGTTISTGVSNIVGGNVNAGNTNAGYTAAGEVTFFYLCSVGANGREDSRQSDDICQSFNTNNNNLDAFSGCGLTNGQVRTLINKAKTAIKSVASQYKGGVRRISIPGVGDNIEVEPGFSSSDSGAFSCQDFFSPGECQVMYNVCDPVICPSSRCNFGGKIAVPNVIQSGIVGSSILCLKNFVAFGGDVYVPVCLTGIHAGIEGYISILKAQQKCLNEYANTGKHVGICDEMTAVYKCEFFWRQVSPLLQNIVPSLAELVYTGNFRGQANGGEYATFQKSWDNMQKSVDYFKNTYAATSFTAYKFGNVDEIGTTYCRNFLGTSLPTSAAAIDSLLKPESPAQFYGTFSSIVYTTATVPSTSQYKVFYHIYAGTDIGASYTVYLKDPPTLSYYNIPSQVHVASGYLTKGEQASETKDFTAPTGYKQLCLVVNNQEQCGFNSISTEFTVNMINDLYVQEQGGENNITTEDGCISGSSSIYSLVNLNAEEGVDNAINPDISLLGITRVCATQNPGRGTNSSNWKNVGYCGSKNLTCWLDQSSVRNAQKVLKNVGSVSEAIEYLALNSTTAVVSSDQEKTIEQLANLRTAVNKLILTKDNIKGGEVTINGAISGLVTQSKSVFENARLDAHKAEALSLQARLYYEVVKYILDIKVADNEKADASIKTPAPAATATIAAGGGIATVADSGSSDTGDTGNSLSVQRDSAGNFLVLDNYEDTGYIIRKSGSLWVLHDSSGLVGQISSIKNQQIEGYQCTFDGSSLSCELGD